MQNGVSMTLQFARYRRDYLEACLALFDANAPEFFHPAERDDYARFLADREVAGGYTVCLDNGEPVGAFGVLPTGEDGVMRLTWIILHPAVQGRGVGRRMLTRAASVARSAGARELAIAASHRSAPFFARVGARELATTPDGWGPGMHRVDMAWSVA